MTSEITRTLGLVGEAAFKVPCRVATTANIVLSGQQTIDGIAAVTGDRVMVKNQTNTIENGIYVCDTGAWTRARDFDGAYDCVNGTTVKVNYGTVGAGFWYVFGTDPIVIGTSALTFLQASTVLTAFSIFAQTLLGSPNAGAFLTNLAISAFIQTLLDDPDAATARATLGVVAPIPISVIDAKGDLVGGTADNAVARLAVGADGQILTADSSKTTGLAWASATIPKPKVGSFTRVISAASGSVAYTGYGGRPKAVIFLSNNGTAGAASWGVDDGATFLALMDNHNSVADSYLSLADGSIMIQYLVGDYMKGHVTSFDADGFTIAYTKVGAPVGTATIIAMAFF